MGKGSRDVRNGREAQRLELLLELAQTEQEFRSSEGQLFLSRDLSILLATL
jgi:hypothetical protein